MAIFIAVQQSRKKEASRFCMARLERPPGAIGPSVKSEDCRAYVDFGGNAVERLLNVREAAEFLNVSEMTVRRWTNSGLLRCFRIGPKRERRFRLSELEEYLTSTAPPQKLSSIPLGFADFKVPDGAHLTHLYLDSREALAVGMAYVLQGIKRDETVLFVAREAETLRLLGALQEQGVDIETLRSSGRLHLSNGMTNPTDQAAQISQVSSLSGGRFRLLGDMMWAKEKGWPIGAVRKLEDMGNARMPSPGKLILCQYSLEGFSGQEAMMAAETHKYTIYRGKIQESPYFVHI
jgi:excisionase family DNA binding protein